MTSVNLCVTRQVCLNPAYQEQEAEFALRKVGENFPFFSLVFSWTTVLGEKRKPHCLRSFVALVLGGMSGHRVPHAVQDPEILRYAEADLSRDPFINARRHQERQVCSTLNVLCFLFFRAQIYLKYFSFGLVLFFLSQTS